MSLPERIGPYKVRELLGAGGMGAVYRAERIDLEREVALKIVPPEMLASRVMRHRFRREARALAAVRHPNVVALLDADLDSSPPYMAMELVEGNSLERRVGPGTPAWNKEKVSRLARDVAAGLAALHRAGLVHRDIKPANVLEDSKGRFRITDFGLVGGERFTRLTGQGDILGTPAYLSPEAWKGRPMTFAADIFQAGVLIYEAWTGASPYGSDLVDIAVNTGNETLEEGTLRSDRLGNVVLKCLRTDPEKRFADGAELVSALQAMGITSVEEDRPPELLPPAPLGDSRPAHRTGRFARPAEARTRWPWMVGFVALFLASALLGTTPDPAGTAASGLRAEASPIGLVCTWRTDKETPSRLVYWDERDGEAPRLRVRTERPTREHRIEVPALPGRRYQVAVESADGKPSLPVTLDLPAIPLEPREMTRELPAGKADRLVFRTALSCRAALEVEGEIRVRGETEGTEHVLELRPLGAGEYWPEVTLVLTPPGGQEHRLALPGGLPGRVGYLLDALAELEGEVLEEIRSLPHELRLFSPEGRRGVIRSLVVRGVFERLDRLKPALQEAFRNPGLELRHRVSLYEALATFDYLDFSEDTGGRPEPLFGVAPLFSPLVKTRFYTRADRWDGHSEVFGKGAWGWLAGDTDQGLLYQTVVEELQTRIQKQIPAFRREAVAEVATLVPPGATRKKVQLAFGVPIGLVFSGVEADIEGRIRLRLPRLSPLRGADRYKEKTAVDGSLAFGWELDPALLGGVRRRLRLRTRKIPGMKLTGAAMGVKDVRWRYE